MRSSFTLEFIRTSFYVFKLNELSRLRGHAVTCYNSLCTSIPIFDTNTIRHIQVRCIKQLSGATRLQQNLSSTDKALLNDVALMDVLLLGSIAAFALTTRRRMGTKKLQICCQRQSDSAAKTWFFWLDCREPRELTKAIRRKQRRKRLHGWSAIIYGGRWLLNWEIVVGMLDFSGSYLIWSRKNPSLVKCIWHALKAQRHLKMEMPNSNTILERFLRGFSNSEIHNIQISDRMEFNKFFRFVESRIRTLVIKIWKMRQFPDSFGPGPCRIGLAVLGWAGTRIISLDRQPGLSLSQLCLAWRSVSRRWQIRLYSQLICTKNNWRRYMIKDPGSQLPFHDWFKLRRFSLFLMLRQIAKVQSF